MDIEHDGEKHGIIKRQGSEPDFHQSTFQNDSKNTRELTSPHPSVPKRWRKAVRRILVDHRNKGPSLISTLVSSIVLFLCLVMLLMIMLVHNRAPIRRWREADGPIEYDWIHASGSRHTSPKMETETSPLRNNPIDDRFQSAWNSLLPVHHRHHHETSAFDIKSKIQHRQHTMETDDQARIKAMMKHSWDAYKKYAWGSDSLRPISRTPGDMVHGLGATILDSIDTLWLMELDDDYLLARDWIIHNLTFSNDLKVQTFEAVIRCLGGLLGIYSLTEDQVFLSKAKELGHRMLPAFEKSPSGWPYQHVNLATGEVYGEHIVLSEASLMEWKYLAQITGEQRFADAANRIICMSMQLATNIGVFFNSVNIESGNISGDISFGAGGDSWYEYLLKMYLQGSRTFMELRALYMRSATGLLTYFISNTQDGAVFINEAIRIENDMYHRKPVMQHLSCFIPGMLLLGSKTLEEAGPFHEMVAHRLLETCLSMYYSSPSHLSGESYAFEEGSYSIRLVNERNLQRPETLESLFIFTRLEWENRAKYRKHAKNIYQAFHRHSRIETGGYACIRDVSQIRQVEYIDHMDSFWLAETLKYLYLIFSEDRYFLHPYKSFIFNTEAHPFKIVDDRAYIANCSIYSVQ